MTGFTWGLGDEEAFLKMVMLKPIIESKLSRTGKDMIVAGQVEGVSSKNHSFILLDHELWEGGLVKAKDDKLDGGWITLWSDILCWEVWTSSCRYKEVIGALQLEKWRDHISLENIVFVAVWNIY